MAGTLLLECWIVGDADEGDLRDATPTTVGESMRRSSPFDWMAEGGPSDDPVDAEPSGRIAERLALARVTQGLIGRKRWPELGRYEIVRRLGKGAFGSVLLARDPKLDRDVAIKIVSLPSGDRVVARDRVTREARALAALTHPGVVGVFDFGIVQDDACRDDHGDPGALYIVMEYLRGDSLRAWLTEPADGSSGPSQPDVLRVFDRVAAGLAAVHAAGLVHRDVKPDNVVLTGDGVPKLVDFGLVRAQGPAGASAELDATEPMSEQSGVPDLLSGEPGTPPQGTEVGTVIGTPQYMAPEQHEGRPATQASDQFALAAALFEALAERMPFSGKDLESLLRDKVHCRLPAPGRPVAPALMAVIRRGLSPRQTDRYPTIEHFRQALSDAAAPKRRRRVTVAALAVLALAPLGVVASGAWSSPVESTPCPEGPLFDDLSAVQRAATDSTDLAGWANLTEELEAYAQGWALTRAQICDAPADDVAVQARRIACLERGAVFARSWLEAMAPHGKTTVAHARTQIDGLPDVGACTTADDDLAGLKPSQRTAITRLEHQLAALEARIRINVTPEAVDEALQAVADARATDHLPLVALALDVAGRLQLDLGRFAEADVTLTEAVWTSLSADRPSRAALVMPRLLYARESASGPDGFDALVPLANRVLDDADAPPALRARVGAMIGYNLLGRSRFDEADRQLHRVKEMLEQAGATLSTDYGETLTGLSAIARNQGRLDDALTLAQTALNVLAKADGPDAPSTAFAHERVGAIFHVRGETAKAAEYYERAIALLQAKYGPEHPDLAWPRLILAMLWVDEGRLDEAAEVGDWALQTAEASVGEYSEMIGVMAHNRSIIAEKRGNLDKALALIRRSRNVHERVAGADSEDVAGADRRIGRLLLAKAEHDDALRVLERARASFDRLGKASDAAECWWLMAQSYDGLKRPTQALRAAQKALLALPADADEHAQVQAFVARHR